MRKRVFVPVAVGSSSYICTNLMLPIAGGMVERSVR